jgi:hypothetical protein
MFSQCVLVAVCVRLSATGQIRKSSEDLSVTVSGVTDRVSFDQCVSYTECVIKTLGSVRKA